MAWMNQERKAALAAGLKIVLPKGWKYSLFGKRNKPFRCSTAPMMGCDKCHAETIDVRRRENGSKLCDLCGEARFAEIADINRRFVEMEAQRGADMKVRAGQVLCHVPCLLDIADARTGRRSPKQRSGVTP